MSVVLRLQHAIRFLDAVAKRTVPSPLKELGVNLDATALVAYAAACGYEVDEASLTEAFRIRMGARAAVQNKRAR